MKLKSVLSVFVLAVCMMIGSVVLAPAAHALSSNHVTMSAPIGNSLSRPYKVPCHPQSPVCECPPDPTCGLKPTTPTAPEAIPAATSMDGSIGYQIDVPRQAPGQVLAPALFDMAMPIPECTPNFPSCKPQNPPPCPPPGMYLNHYSHSADIETEQS
jgi:hypothetical protein